MKELDIAIVAHEMNRAYCQFIGDDSQLPWDEAPDWQQESALNGVMFHVSNPDSLPEESHTNWLNEKIKAGWIFGPIKDEVAKTHPCCVPYDQLPDEQKLKDILFKQVVDSLKDYLDC